MKFNLGKTKDSDRTIENETINRWRQVSLNDVADENPHESVVVHSTEDEVPWGLGSDADSSVVVRPNFRTGPDRPLGSSRSPSLSLEETIRARFGTEVKTAIASGTMIEGKFSFDSPVRIDGDLRGTVVSSSVLIVGENATVEAEIQVGSLIVLGHVTGSVEAKELVEIKTTGHLVGNIRTERIAIEEGGYFKGGCNVD